MKKGSDAKVSLLISNEQVTISALATWTYSGETRDLLEEVTFETEHHIHEAGLMDGGEVECTGFYRLDEDPGQKFLEELFQAASHIAANEIRLYLDDKHYLTPDELSVPASYMVLTKFRDVGQDASGTGTFAFSGKVSGRMKEATDE